MVTAGVPPGSDLPGVNFYSPIGVVSGLGAAGRGYLAALRLAAVPVSLVPVHELFVHQASVGRAERRQRPRYPISIIHINADAVHRWGELGGYEQPPLAAINETYVKADAPLHEGDELAFIPPVAGG